MATILASVIHGGALERYPNLRIVLGESGIGWIPYVLDAWTTNTKTASKAAYP